MEVVSDVTAIAQKHATDAAVYTALFHVYFHLGDLDTVLVPLLSQIWSHIYNKTEYMNSLLEGALLFFFSKSKLNKFVQTKMCLK